MIITGSKQLNVGLILGLVFGGLAFLFGNKDIIQGSIILYVPSENKSMSQINTQINKLKNRICMLSHNTYKGSSRDTDSNNLFLILRLVPSKLLSFGRMSLHLSFKLAPAQYAWLNDQTIVWSVCICIVDYALMHVWTILHSAVDACSMTNQLCKKTVKCILIVQSVSNSSFCCLCGLWKTKRKNRVRRD